MSLSLKKIAELSDELAEQLRLLAMEHPASGKLKVMFRNAMVETFGGVAKKMAMQHMKEAAKVAKEGSRYRAAFHLGAALCLKDVSSEYVEAAADVLSGDDEEVVLQ